MEALAADPDTEPGMRSEALALLGYVARARGETARAEALATEALAIARREGHHFAVTMACFVLAGLAFNSGNAPLAQAFTDEQVAAARAHGNRTLLAETLACRAVVVTDLDEAQRYLEQSADMGRELGETTFLPLVMDGLAANAFQRGNYAEAARLVRAELRMVPEFDQVVISDLLLDLAATLARLGHPTQSARMVGAIQTLRERIGVEPNAAAQLVKALTEYETLTELQAAIEPAALEDALEQGRQLSLKAAIQEALREEQA
jgi:tetratricopeptide (TPR) repeat protein